MFAHGPYSIESPKLSAGCAPQRKRAPRRRNCAQVDPDAESSSDSSSDSEAESIWLVAEVR